MEKTNKTTQIEVISGPTTNGVLPEAKTFYLSVGNESGEVEIERLYTLDEFAKLWGLCEDEKRWMDVHELEPVKITKADGTPVYRADSMQLSYWLESKRQLHFEILDLENSKTEALFASIRCQRLAS